MKFIPKEKDLQSPVYMLETNFTMSCVIMPWTDNKVRLISHMQFTDDKLDISGRRTIRPMGIFNKTKLVLEDVPYIEIKNKNNY